VFGLGNRLSFGFTTQPNPNATAWYDNFSGNISYTIPWIDLDFLDFKTVRTPVSFTVYSSINQAQAIPGQETGANAKPVGSEYRTFSTRASGIGITVGRTIAENVALRFGISYSYQANSLEHGDPAKLNPNLKDDAVAQALLTIQAPTSSTLTTFSEITYSTRNDLNFPTGGSTVQASASYSFGTKGMIEGVQGRTRALNWSQFTMGYSTYLGFGFDQNGQFDLGENRNMALAFRINGGAQLGDAPRNSQFRIGDAGSGNEAFVLRGYNNGDLRGDVYYSGSLEYRYDFGLKTAFNNALLGIAFVDFANAWGNAGPRPLGVGDGVQFGYGLGAQINLQLGALTLPPLGFYYGWSPANPSGRFHFVFSFRF
jgi:outer membrane protein insertion porin family